MIYIGIDPGIGGALALIHSDNREIVLHDMPIQAKRNAKNEIDPMGLFKLLPAAPDLVRIMIEQVSARPGQGVSSMFSLGDSFGCVRACAAIYGASYSTIAAASWKRAVEIPPKSLKEYSVTRALQLYPEARPMIYRKKDHGRADALLIAHVAMITAQKGEAPR